MWSAWTNGTAGFKGDGHLEISRVSCICGVFGGLPAELWLAVQCLRHVLERGSLMRGGADQHATEIG
jgi:hypothetical protein